MTITKKSDVQNELRDGFSLIELSVVLVIIGLVAGGITVGQNMLRNAEIMSVARDAERYRQSVAAFQSQYKELPGDFTRAESIWGSATDCPTSENITQKKETCNGNGNGRIGDSGSYNEPYAFWQHLSDAGLVEGTYTGNQEGGMVPGVNLPKLKFSTGQMSVSYFGNVSGQTNIFDDSYGHVFIAAAKGDTALLNPSDTINLDRKFDDGDATTGTIMVFKRTACYPGEIGYNPTADTPACRLIFKSGF